MLHTRIGTRRVAALGLLVSLVAAHGVALGAKAPKSDLTNGSFERASGKSVYGWSTPKYWGGAIVAEAGAGMARSGKRCAKLTTSFSRKKHWGRTLTSARRMKFFVGSRHRYSMWVKGKGEFVLGYIQYVPSAMRKPPYKYYMQETPTTLTDTWQQVVYEFTMDDPRTSRIAPVAELRGEGAVAWLDDATLTSAADPDAAIRVEPHHPMLAPGGSVDIQVAVLKGGKPLASGEITVILPAKEGVPKTTTLALGKSGTVTYRFTAAAGTEQGIHALTFSHAATGVGQPIAVDVVDKATYAAFEQAASKTKLDGSPAHYLFIGDSLTDFFRDRNYVDKVGFWLRKVHGPKATVRNVGVGGDFITRVWQRLNKDPKSYRLNMYDDLYDPMPTHVFWFLGHNDSKLASRSGYKDACVPPDRFEAEYRLAIRKVQKDTKARITVMSASSSVFEITKANSDKRAAAGRAHNLFGQPAALEQFNAIAKKVADECGAGYLDVYEPTRAHADKPSLFTPDGVHVNNNGNRLLALEILKYLGR